MENSIQNQEAYLIARERVKKIKGFYIHLSVYVVVNAFIIGGTFVDRPFSYDNFLFLIHWIVIHASATNLIFIIANLSFSNH